MAKSAGRDISGGLIDGGVRYPGGRLPHDEPAGLKLRHQVDREENEKEKTSQESQSWALKTIAQNIRHSNGPRQARNLIEPFSQHAFRDHTRNHVATDPQCQDQTETINERWKADKTAGAYRSSYIGEAQHPSIKLAVTEKIFLEKRAAFEKLMRKGAEEKDADHVSG